MNAGLSRAAAPCTSGGDSAAAPPNVGDWIHANARRLGNKPALVFDGQALGYVALARRIDECAGALGAAGVGRGAIVAWLGANSAALLTMLFACARLGAIFMPMNWRLAPPEHRSVLVECAPALFVAEGEFAAQSASAGVAPPATRCIAIGAPAPAGWTAWDAFLERSPSVHARAVALPADAPLLLCYTSGSTGRPKGVVLAHAALAANADASVDMHALVEADRILTTLPLFHVGGLNIQTLPALRSGATVWLHARFDAAAALATLERERITLTVLVPAQLDAIVALPQWPAGELGALRAISTGSTLVPMRLIDAVHARGVPLIQVWGATETCPIAACLHADEARAHAGSAGRAALGVELRIVDVDDHDVPPGRSGEILVRGANVMSGYWRDAQASARALAGGWYHSGDSGHFDAAGYLWVDGRLKDMIISGGENVSPAEVEAVLLGCADIAEAAVVGRPDARWGELVVAVVAPAPGATLDRARVLALFDGRLARFKQPKDVYIVDALPRTALGKVRKEDVRTLVARLAAANHRETHA